MMRLIKKSYSFILLLAVIAFISMLIGCSAPQSAANKQDTIQTQVSNLKGSAGKPSLSITGATDFGTCMFVGRWQPTGVFIDMLLEKTQSGGGWQDTGSSYYPFTLKWGSWQQQVNSLNSGPDLSYQWDIISTLTANGTVNLIKCVDQRLVNAYPNTSFYLASGLDSDGDGNTYFTEVVYLRAVSKSVEANLASLVNNDTSNRINNGKFTSSTWENIAWKFVNGVAINGENFYQIKSSVAPTTSYYTIPDNGIYDPYAKYYNFVLNYEHYTTDNNYLEYSSWPYGWMGWSSQWHIDWSTDD
jgi:hypothetical protein